MVVRNPGRRKPVDKTVGAHVFGVTRSSARPG
jgi:hypothetical protein